MKPYNPTMCQVFAGYKNWRKLVNRLKWLDNVTRNRIECGLFCQHHTFDWERHIHTLGWSSLGDGSEFQQDGWGVEIFDSTRTEIDFFVYWLAAVDIPNRKLRIMAKGPKERFSIALILGRKGTKRRAIKRLTLDEAFYFHSLPTREGLRAIASDEMDLVSRLE